MVTYNHADFIEKAIESIMMQNSNFNYKLFIGEDNSVDKTREICQILKEKYPDKIELVLHKKNIGSNPNGFFMYQACFDSGAKYIALCEGDDYWTDPNKLQKQVDFLEANEEYVMSFHDAIQVDETNCIINDKASPYVYNKDLNSLELKKVAAEIPTMTRVFRNVLNKIPKELENLVNGDVVLASLCGQFGKCKFIDDIKPAAYRIHSGGTWSGNGQLHRIKSSIDTCKGLYQYYKVNNDLEVAESFFKQYLSILEQLYWYSFQYRNWFYFKTAILERYHYRSNIQTYKWQIEMKNLIKFIFKKKQNDQ
jgi:glycosyltransferase involved in cell wall biosynthesis